MPRSVASHLPSILILGASTRAAAHSAIRAGLRPICADLFADADLHACTQIVDVARYPHDLPAAAAGVPPCPWMYTGGLENHPRLVGRISESRPMWGNGPDVLRRVRDPWYVHDLLEEAELPALCVWPRRDAPPPADETWIQKALHGAAGRGIRVWDHAATRRPSLREVHCFQERRCGSPVSALYLATPQQTALLGITRQLVGVPEVHAPPFAWCGTIAPICLPNTVIVRIRKIGEALGSRCGLRGLFGCDFLVERDQAWLTEVNPRYPASTEIFEQILQVPLLDWHRRAFLDSASFVVPPSLVAAPSGGADGKPPECGTTNDKNVLGKIVLYAPRDIIAPDATRFIHTPSPWLNATRARDVSLPYMADIPVPDQPISRGQPICTLFARARTEAGCRVKLIRRATQFERRLN